MQNPPDVLWIISSVLNIQMVLNDYYLKCLIPLYCRVLWVLCVLSAIAFFTAQVYDRVIVYYNYETNVNVQVLFSDKMDFPAVTICNQNTFRSIKMFLCLGLSLGLPIKILNQCLAIRMTGWCDCHCLFHQCFTFNHIRCSY